MSIIQQTFIADEFETRINGGLEIKRNIGIGRQEWDGNSRKPFPQTDRKNLGARTALHATQENIIRCGW